MATATATPISRRTLLAAGSLVALAAPHVARASVACGNDSRLCELLDRAGRDDSNTHAALIQRGAVTLAEAYFTGQDRPSGAWFSRRVEFGPQVLHDLRSVSKSVVGLLVGIVLAQGRLGGLTRPVFDFFPEHADLLDELRRKLTLRHLLDMTPGWDWDETNLSYADPRNSESRMGRAGDPVRHVLELPLVAPPGTKWEYCGGATMLLAEILERTTGRPLAALAQEMLFAPLGVAQFEWRKDARGKALAFSGLRLTPRDLARIGRLRLAKGQWAELADRVDRAVLPEAWVTETFTPRQPAWDGFRYGAQWWHGPFAQGPGSGIPWVSAWGNGGQRLFVVPSLHLVVVVTAGRYNEPNNGRASNRIFRRTLEMLTT